eukprot:Selendium_serpulae@DN6513_c1_g2_i1.p4
MERQLAFRAPRARPTPRDGDTRAATAGRLPSDAEAPRVAAAVRREGSHVRGHAGLAYADVWTSGCLDPWTRDIGALKQHVAFEGHYSVMTRSRPSRLCPLDRAACMR